MCKLTIEIETQEETELYKLFLHVFREITEIDYRDDRLEEKARFKDNWLEVLNKGRYKWEKHVDKSHNMS